MEAELANQRNAQISDVEFCASDVSFHCLIVDATQNPLLRFLIEAVIEIMQPVLNLLIYQFRERRLITEQQEIFEAIKTHDPERAVTALDRQMEYLRQKYAIAQQQRQEREAATGK